MAYERTAPSAESLLVQYRHSGDLALRDKLVTMHLYIADIVARRFAGRGVDRDDLYQVASLALLKAVERFDVSKGVKFSTYATPTMIGEVKNYFRDKSRVISLPRRTETIRLKIVRAREELEQQLMRAPTPVEMADWMGESLELVIEALETMNAISPISLDDATTGDDETPLANLFGREEAGYEEFAERDRIARAMTLLSDDEVSVIQMRYRDEMSQRAIGEKMDISQMTVSRIERRAIEKIRNYFKATEEEKP